MRAFIYLTVVAGLVFVSPVSAIILDEEPPKPIVKPKAAKPKPKVRKKSQLELENERMRKELAALKREQQGNESQETANDTIGIEMVDLPNSLRMGKYEVTQEQWRAVMGNNPPGFADCGHTCPVDNVSWDDVQVFIEKLNRQTVKHYRLPTEDEWYGACLAGQTTEYCGSDNIEAVAWYDHNSGNRTHPAGQKQANAWGLYDMSGNVWEWTSSCLDGDCSLRVYRGGSLGYGPARVLAAHRYWNTTTFSISGLGFRLAQDR